MQLGAFILAGGRSARMGADKASLLWRGRRAVDRVADAARALGADPVLTVGPHAYGLPAVTDEAANGGPVAGLIAGFVALRAAGCHRALVLAVDAPTLQPEDLAPLLAAPAPGAVFDGLNLPLVIALEGDMPEAAPGASIRSFIAQAKLVRLPCPPDAARRLRGANTPQEREALLAEVSDQIDGAG